MGIGDKASRQLVNDKMLQLEQDGVIEQKHRGKYKLKEEYISDFVKTTELEGVVDMTMSGKAYIITKDLDEDIYIAANHTGHAFMSPKE